jgi:hypothetical protein
MLFTEMPIICLGFELLVIALDVIDESLDIR